MSAIKLKIDIKGGMIDVESDAESFEGVMRQAGELLDKFATLKIREITQEPATDLNRDAEPSKDDEQRPSEKGRRRKGTGTAKTANWQMVDNLLSAEDRAKLKEFYAAKKPRSQNEKVAVLVFKLKELTGRDGFDGNEVHTALQAVGEKTPGNLRAVFGNMAAASLGNTVHKRFVPNFKTGDLVNHDLPAKAKSD